jgi:MurNAc alpha-1-phosphate uridylyltransferase
MKAMILAAGRGERLRPLTDTIPKPLIEIQGKPLIVYHLEKLAAAGFKDVVINIAHLGEKIQTTLGNGQAFDLNIIYSPEGGTGLETGGGIFNALPLLGNEPFITINADIFTDFDFTQFEHMPLPASILANLVLLPHTKNRPEGDFSLYPKTSLVSNDFPRPYTIAGISLYRPEFFESLSHGKYSVTPVWRQYADQRKILGTVFKGNWHDVGTVETLVALNASSCTPHPPCRAPSPTRGEGTSNQQS